MTIIRKYVNSTRNGSNGHTGDDPINQPWQTIKWGVDWFRDHKQPGDTGILNLIGAFQENVSMVGQKYSNITIQAVSLGAYNPSILEQYCEARPQVGGNPATGARRSGTVFKIERADGVVLSNLAILLAERGVDADHAGGLILDNCCIHDHLTQEPGAGFRLNACDKFQMKQCRVWTNKTTTPTGDGGGGALYKCNDAKIEGSLFYLNEAGGNGGGLYIEGCGSNPFDDLFGGSGAGVSIAGCTIGGQAGPNPLAHIGPNRAHDGGGIAIRDSKVVFKTGIGPLATSGNVPTRIELNVAEENGGGIFFERDEDDCSVELQEKTDVLGNTAAIQGGGIAVYGGDNAGNLPSLKIDHSLLDGNEVDDGTRRTGYGGGIYGKSLECTIEQTTIFDNRAALRGGGIYIEGNDDGTFLNISSHCVLERNRADGDYNPILDIGPGGGGIYGQDCPINIKDSNFLDNYAKGDGGGILIYPGDYALDADAVEFTHNTVGGDGGAIAAHGSAVVDECHFTRNEALSGAGLFSQADVELTGSEFTQNTAKDGGLILGKGGGCFLNFSTAGMIDSNKFVGNQADEGAGIFLNGSDLTQLTVTGNEFAGNTDVKGPGSGADILAKSSNGANQATLIANNTFKGPPDVVVTP